MNINDISIGSRKVGVSHRPLIIAEMSGNHNRSLDRAIKIVEAAAEAGADGIKLQTYTADTMTLPGAFTIKDPDSPWDGRELHELYKDACTPWEWHKPLFEKAKSIGLEYFSSPFDETAVDFLESLDVPAYKIASFENTDLPLLKKIAGTKKPVIMSTGVSTLSDVDEGVRVLRENGCNEIILLKCTSTYPASPENSNISSITHMKDTFQCHIGLSDHTLGIGVAIASVSFGARLIEKHLTISRSDGGVDSSFSMEPEELKNLVIETERAFQAIGEVHYGVQSVERKNLIYKRSIYASSAIKKGEVFTPENIRIIKPGYGLEPKYYEKILGRKAIQDIPSGTPLTWDLL
jgi:pseudaminic acid synthase